jgi:hypothetical protein
MSCRSLRKVDFQEGVEEICNHAFGATQSLTEVYLPDSLKKVDYYLFGLGGDSPYATAYLSGKLARQLYDVNGDGFKDIYARHVIIDGKPYDSVKAYLYTIGIHAKDYYAPYDPEAAAREAEERARQAEEDKKQYRADMEAACKEGKTLQEMIEASRKAINEDEYSDKDAFEQAIRYLDKNATVSFAGKHFVLTGFGIYEDDVIAEIKKRGGIIHSSMVKMADYLIVCLESPGAAKVNKALEWRQKGASNLIVSDFQMWQAIFGKASLTSSGTKRPTHSDTSTTRSSQVKRSKAAEPEQKVKPTAESKQKPPVQKPKERKYGWIGDIIPEDANQAEIEKELEEMSDEDAQTMINTMRQMKDIEKQISELRGMVEQAKKAEEAKAEPEEQSRWEAEEQARRETEELKRRDAEEKSRLAAEAKEKRDTKERTCKATEEATHREAEDKAKREEEKAKTIERAKTEDISRQGYCGTVETVSADWISTNKYANLKGRLQKDIDQLKDEAEALRGIFAFVKRNKIYNQIEQLEDDISAIERIMEIEEKIPQLKLDAENQRGLFASSRREKIHEEIDDLEQEMEKLIKGIQQYL